MRSNVNSTVHSRPRRKQKRPSTLGGGGGEGRWEEISRKRTKRKKLAAVAEGLFLFPRAAKMRFAGGERRKKDLLSAVSNVSLGG